jgi:hypothetical protein
MALSRSRQSILDLAEQWASPGTYKPTADELIGFFADAQCEQQPSLADAQKSLNRLGGGCYVGGAVKQWCGIFACAVLADSGIGVRWSMMSGKPVATEGAMGFRVHWGNTGIRPGDIAVVQKYQHHFVVTDVDYQANVMSSVDGNQAGNTIHDVEGRSISKVYAYYSFDD